MFVISCIWQPTPFGLSCSAIHPVIPLLKAGRQDCDLLKVIFRRRRNRCDAFGKYLNQRNKTELKYVVAKIALLIRALPRAPLMFRPQSDDSDSHDDSD